MLPLPEEIEMLNEGIVLGFSFATLLVVAYFKYDTSPIFRAFGNIFIKFSIIKRDKRDLLLFALIPFTTGVFSFIYRILLL